MRPEELEWDRDEVARAALAYEAGLLAGDRSGYHRGLLDGRELRCRRHRARRLLRRLLRTDRRPVGLQR